MRATADGRRTASPWRRAVAPWARRHGAGAGVGPGPYLLRCQYDAEQTQHLEQPDELQAAKGHWPSHAVDHTPPVGTVIRDFTSPRQRPSHPADQPLQHARSAVAWRCDFRAAGPADKGRLLIDLRSGDHHVCTNSKAHLLREIDVVSDFRHKPASDVGIIIDVGSCLICTFEIRD